MVAVDAMVRKLTSTLAAVALATVGLVAGTSGAGTVAAAAVPRTFALVGSLRTSSAAQVTGNLTAPRQP